MPVRNTGLNEAGLRASFFEAFSSTPTYYQDLSTRFPSTTDEEKYGWLGSVPLMREWGTGRLAKGLRSESYSVKNLKYEATIEVDRDEIDDDQTNQIRMRVNELAEAAAVHKDFLIEQLLINGATEGYNAHDGLPFFSDAHLSGDSGSQSNKLTYTASDADVPTTAEFRGALGKAIASMVAFKDDRGNPKRIAPDGLVCVVPPTMLITAMEAISMQFTNQSSNPLELNILRNFAKVIAMPGLTDGTKWYLLKTNAKVRPFIFQDRAPVEFGAMENDSESGFKREIYLYGVRARYRMTYGYWHYAVQTEFTE